MTTYENKEKTKATSIPATYLSLCSGYDGIGIALKRIFPNLRTCAHVEIESFAIANVVAKMEEGQLDSCPVFTDVKRFPFEDLRGRIGILSAGFPCQPFSSAGKRQATDDPRHIYPSIANGISVCRPAYVLLENVEGIISAKTGDGESVLKHVLGDLESRGYTCAWGTFSAAEVIGGDGRRIPHLRKRVFILAKLADCDVEGLEGHGGSVVESEASERKGERDEWSVAFGGLQHSVYPARPNEPQRWWEEPRVVGQLADSRHAEPSGRNEAEEGCVQEPLGESSPQDSGGGELADSKSGKPRKSKGGDGRKDTGGGSEEELGNTSIKRREQDSALRNQQQAGRTSEVSRGGGSEEGREVVDDASNELRPKRQRDERTSEVEVNEPRDASVPYVGDSSSERSRGGSADGADVESEVPRKGSESDVQEVVPETQPELGRTVDAWGGLRGVDATANRVDRLRLLGNGVVPATCELAFRTLYNRLNGDTDNNE